MHTNTTFPALLSAEDAIAQDEAKAAAAKAAADAKHWHQVAVALRVIDQAGYMPMAERLLDADSDSNACTCRSAIAWGIIRELRLPTYGELAHDCSVDRAGSLIDVAVKGIVKARTNPATRRRMANLLAHGSPDGLVA